MVLDSMRRLPAAHGDVAVRCAAVVGCIVSLVVMWPGMMMWDSIDQLLQARAGVFNDWHPPLMTFLWRWLDKALPGPFPMLVLQMLTLWMGGYLVVRAAGSGAAAVRIAVLWAAILFPPVLCVMGFVTKDAVLTSLLLFAFGFVPLLREWQGSASWSRRSFIGGITVLACVLVLAAGMRYNAIGAVWVACAFAVHELVVPSLGLGRSLGLGLALAVACSGVAAGSNTSLTGVRTHPWISVAAHDIAGVARRLGTVDFISAADRKTLAGEAPGGEWTMERMQKGGREWNHMLAAGLHVEASPTLRRVWWECMSNQPAVYLDHRLEAFGRNLVFTGEPTSQCVRLAVVTGVGKYDEKDVPDLIGHHHELTRLQLSLRKTFVRLAFRTILFWPGVYLAMGVVAALVGVWGLFRGSTLPFFLAASGLAQQATLLFLAPSANYRYSHWLVTSAWLACLLLAADACVAAAARWPGAERHVAADSPEGVR